METFKQDKSPRTKIKPQTVVSRTPLVTLASLMVKPSRVPIVVPLQVNFLPALLFLQRCLTPM